MQRRGGGGRALKNQISRIISRLLRPAYLFREHQLSFLTLLTWNTSWEISSPKRRGVVMMMMVVARPPPLLFLRLLQKQNENVFGNRRICRLLSCQPLTTAAHLYDRASDSSTPNPLLSWVCHQGGFVHSSLRLLPLEGFGLGLVSSIPVTSGTPLLSLPHRLPLTLPSPHTAVPHTADAALLDLAHRVPEELWALKLGLKLLMERARMGSFWWPYISNLPQRFTLPIFFSREEIAALQYAPVIHQVKKRCRALLDLAAVVHSATGKLPTEHKPFGSEQVDANALGWAMAAVSSRAFCLHRLEGALEESVGRNHMLLPLVDMCNHSFSPNARIVQQKGKLASIMVLSEQDLEPGTPILLSYGPLNNDILLLDYGFVVPQNKNDCIELRYDGLLLEAARVTAGLRSAAFSCPAPWQQIILQQLNLQGVGASLQVTVGGPDLVDGRLLAALRALFAEVPEELQKTDLNALQSWSSAAPLGLTNESNVLKTLVAMCAIALGHFPTTLAEDEKTLADKALTEAMRLAVQFRMAKKQVLVDAMRGFTRKLSQLGIVESSKIYER